jgi:hypothetical protein
MSLLLVKQIFATVKPRFMPAKLKIQYSYVHSNVNAKITILLLLFGSQSCNNENSVKWY